DLAASEKRVQQMGFTTRSALEILAEIRRGLLFMQALLGSVGFVALSVASLGIANTFLTAVYERTHEIGIRRAVGARRRDIRHQFLFEAAMLGFAGALGGLALAWIGNRYVGTALAAYFSSGEKIPEPLYVFSPRLVIGCLAFAVVVSIAA